MRELIELNELKHHHGAIEEFMTSRQNSTISEGFRRKINRIGNSTLDLYFGKLSIEEIKSEVYTYLQVSGIGNKPALKRHIGANTGHSFLNITLSDKSNWTLRVINKKRFIHLHPSRYSNLSMRCAGSTLKTVITTYCCFATLNPSIAQINDARKEIRLPGIQKLIKNRGLHKLFAFFRSRKEM